MFENLKADYRAFKSNRVERKAKSIVLKHFPNFENADTTGAWKDDKNFSYTWLAKMLYDRAANSVPADWHDSVVCEDRSLAPFHAEDWNA